VKAVDTDWTINNQSWFTTAHNDGIGLFILDGVSWGTCTPWPQAQSEFKMALAAGMKIGMYTRNPNCWAQGLQSAGSYVSQLQFFAIDEETASDGLPASAPVTQAMVTGIQAKGVRPIIYTSSDMWPSLKNSNWSNLPLWDENAGNSATLTANYLSPTPQVYAGWNTPTTMRIGVQQSFNYKLDGIETDLSSFSASFLK